MQFACQVRYETCAEIQQRGLSDQECLPALMHLNISQLLKLVRVYCAHGLDAGLIFKIPDEVVLGPTHPVAHAPACQVHFI